MTDLKGVEMTIVLAVTPNDSNVYKNAWTAPQDYLWLKKTLVLPGVNSSRQFARDEVERLVKLDSICKCPEYGKGRHERILATEYGIPIYYPKNVYNWGEFSDEFCPKMDSLIENKFGYNVFRNISYRLNEEDSIKKRMERKSYPEYPKGDNALTLFFKENVNLDSLVCYSQKNVLLIVDVEVDSSGMAKYIGSTFKQMNSYDSLSFKNYDSSDCSLIQNELVRLIPLMPKWIPATDGFGDNTTMTIRLNYIYYHNGALGSYISKYNPQIIQGDWCGHSKRPKKWQPHLNNRSSAWTREP